MSCKFDQIIDRCGTDSEKWCCYPEDALPLSVADMDFRSPEAVIRALHERVEHGVFGYGVEPPELREVIMERLEQLYGWNVKAEELVFLPGVVPGFNLACQALSLPGDGVLVQTPVYPPILSAPANAACSRDEMQLTPDSDGRHVIDFDLFEETITRRTRVFILCNPHNPVGRVFTPSELERMAEICLRRNVVICSDEIHSDFVYRGHHHIPIGTLSAEVADQTITLLAPSKTFNLAGLHCAVAVVPNRELREKLCAARRGVVGEPDILSYTAAMAAYRNGQDWLNELMAYLQANRDFTFDFVQERLPGISMALPEGTYLAWLDCRDAGIPGNLHQFFLQQAKVVVNDGPDYGKGGEGFVRLNFGCPRSTLAEALQKMEQALQVL